MTAPQRRGWCPSLLTPMETGDGWLARVKPTAGLLTAATARALAEAAARHGNGHLDLTNRATLQVRGLSPESLQPFAEAVLALGLAVPDPAAEVRRSVITSPLAGDDPACLDMRAFASALEAALVVAGDLAQLPGKFGFLLDGGGRLPLRAAAADVGFHATDHERFVLTLGDTKPVALCRREDVPQVALSLARVFHTLAGTDERRMRDLVAKLGADAILTNARHQLSLPCGGGLGRGRFGEESAGVEIVTAPSGSLSSPPPPQGREKECGVRDDEANVERVAGYLSYGNGCGAFAAAAAFGRTTVCALSALAGLAEHYGDGTLRLSPWRALLLPGIAAKDARALAAAVAAAGFIVDTADPRLAVAACPGAPACRSASVPAAADATLFATALGAPRPGVFLHVTGCSKGCAHPAAAAVTLVGRDGRYDLVLGGRPGDAPEATGLTREEVAARLASWRTHV